MRQGRRSKRSRTEHLANKALIYGYKEVPEVAAGSESIFRGDFLLHGEHSEHGERSIFPRGHLDWSMDWRLRFTTTRTMKAKSLLPLGTEGRFHDDYDDVMEGNRTIQKLLGTLREGTA